MLNKIFDSKDPEKSWKESQSVRELLWTLEALGYADLVRCRLTPRHKGNCATCAATEGWTADDIREWIPEFPL